MGSGTHDNRLIAMCLNETCNKVDVGKHLPDNYHIHNGLKQGDALLSLVFNFAFQMSHMLIGW
jgi:hypothetical protein